MAKVLLAEDDQALGKILTGLLETSGLEVEYAVDGQDALERYEAASTGGAVPDVVLSDISMPRLDGLQLLDRLRLLDPHLPVILITAYSSVDTAVAALRKGASDYITKPFRNEHLVRLVHNAAERRRLRQENSRLKQAVQRTFGFQEIVTRSPGMQQVLRLVERAAPSQSSLLIRGETGTGKELVARAAHYASPRADGPFVSVNCAALPEGLLESELFGHVKGAFTGAVRDSQGLFRAAHGGTLFLDEVGDMSPAIQAKLLRVLETREVRPVGATQEIPVDVRLLAATHRDLLGEEGIEFREDLYYRLAVIEVEIPPLRERPEDIPLLARHCLGRIARERAEEERSLALETLNLLSAYPWPGNVRELLNALEHAVTLGQERLLPEDLPPRIRRATERGALPEAVDESGAVVTLIELERGHVSRVLERVAGDRREAARLLGIDLSTLYRKLKRWQEQDPPQS